jgi:hypothetical protein
MSIPNNMIKPSDVNMDPQNPEIKFSKKWYNIRLRYIIAYFIGIIIVPLYLGLPVIMFAGVLIPILGTIYVGTRGDIWVNSLKNQQFPEKLDIRKQDHDAIVIVHSMGSFSAYPYVGLDILIPHFIRNKFPFKIYHCYNPQEFLDILKNDKAKYLWIIGHGWHGGITFKWMRFPQKQFFRTSNRTLFPYAKIRNNLEEFPKKAFIAQFHCNHIDNTYPYNESLVEILLESFDESRYYITDGVSHVASIWFAMRDLIPNVKRTSVSEPEIQVGIEPDSGGCSWIHLI